MATLVNLADLTNEERLAFGQTLIDANYFGDIQSLQTFYMQGYKSDLISDIYGQWQELSSPIVGAPSWDEFVSYALGHRG